MDLTWLNDILGTTIDSSGNKILTVKGSIQAQGEITAFKQN